MSTRFRFLCAGLCVAAALVAATATASPVDKRTTFTFSAPVAIPGVTLPAGSYVFHVADADTAHDVIQVLSADGRVPYAMFFGIETWRDRASTEPEVRFLETGSGMPHAIRSFWYPGDTIGWEFLYPRAQAQLLANGIHAPVLVAPLEGEPWFEPEAITPEVTHEAVVAEPIAVAEAPAAVPEAPPVDELPTTDSPTLTVFLAGFAALVAGLLVHRARRVQA